MEGMAAVDVQKEVWEMLELVEGWERVMQHGEGNGDGASHRSTKCRLCVNTKPCRVGGASGGSLST